MSFFGRLFSSPDTVNKTVDAVISTGDALWFTPEEKSIANQTKLDWVLKYHEASKGSNLARRYISIMFASVFLFLVIITALLILVNSPDRSKLILDLITNTLIQPISIIIAFYFLSGMVTTSSNKK